MISVLVIGESCNDKFIYCNSDRLSPEAPVPILVPVNVIENIGMSGNVVKNLISLNNEINVTHWNQLNNIEKIRYVDLKSNHMFIRVDIGDSNVDKFILTDEKIQEIKNYDIVIVSDYNKGFLSLDDIFIIGNNSKLSILDTKRKINNKILNSFSFIKLNEKEYENNKHLVKFDNVLITLGSKGTKYKDIIYPSPEPKETIDVSGAGDTFTASFILKQYETKDVSQSIKYANKMSSIVVSKKGVSTP